MKVTLWPGPGPCQGGGQWVWTCWHKVTTILRHQVGPKFIIPDSCWFPWHIVHRFNLLHLLDLHSPRFHRCRTHWRCRLVLPWLETSWCIGKNGLEVGVVMSLKLGISIKNWMGPYQRTPKQVAWAIRYSAGPVGDFLDATELSAKRYSAFAPLCYFGSFNETAHESQMLSGTKQMNIQQICGWRFSTSLDFGSFRDLIYGLWIYAKAT